MTKDQGWHGDSKGHAKAAKGMKAKDSGSSASGQGWHGDATGHAKAAKGKSSKDNKGLIDKIIGE